MLVKIEMVGGEEKREFRNKETKELMCFRDQTGYAFLNGGPYPEKIRVSLGESSPPFAIGQYWLTPESFTVGRYGNLEIKRQPVLVLCSPEHQYLDLKTGEILDRASVAKVRAA